MANPKHVQILRKGVRAWNAWRRKPASPFPKLSGVRFNGAELDGIDLENADLRNADLSGASLLQAEFSMAILDGANLDGAVLSGANFTQASLDGVSLRKAYLFLAFLRNTTVVGTNFEGAELGRTVFGAVDLSRAVGLDSTVHQLPSIIGVDTLYESRGRISDKFLRDAGVPEGLISYLPSLVGSADPIQFHSCFISYSTKDEKFAQRLHARMRQAGLRVWFAPEDMKGGDYFFEQIERAIQLHDRLLLVLSEDSIQSKWVEREIRRARKVERAEKRRKLFPIRLVDMKKLRAWECLDSDTGEDLAEEVRKYHIPDFSNWKNHDAFEKAFAGLEKDLRTSINKS